MMELYAGMELYKWILIGLVTGSAGAGLGLVILAALWDMRCAFCARPIAIYWRANGRACRRCKESIDRDVENAAAGVDDRKPRLRIHR
jgi:hypothetical protein